MQKKVAAIIYGCNCEYYLSGPQNRIYVFNNLCIVIMRICR